MLAFLSRLHVSAHDGPHDVPHAGPIAEAPPLSEIPVEIDVDMATVVNIAKRTLNIIFAVLTLIKRSKRHPTLVNC